MTINSFDLYLVNRIQEKGKIDLAQANTLFGKSASTIRRSIDEINSYLPIEKQFIINELQIINQLNYYDYLNFIQHIELKRFTLSLKERTEYCIVRSFIEGDVNLTLIYEELGVSVSTKKKDRQFINEYLTQQNLTLNSVPGRGVSVVGMEQQFRILVCKILLKLVEIDENNQLTQRLANNPIERKIFSFYQEKLFSQSSALLHDIENRLNQNRYRIGYTSKKFLYLYYLLANYRIKQNNLITQIAALPVKVTEHVIFTHHQENTFINGLLCSLDYNGNNPIILDATLGELTIQFIDQIENQIITTFYTKSLLFQQCYNYLYKTILRDYFYFDFYDNKLDDTQIEYAFLYAIIKTESDIIKHNFTQLNDNHIATLTLIFRHHVLKNKLFGRNQKSIVIVTNSAKEKASFFAELLEYYVDVKIVDTIHINELYRLNQYKFDYLITFSNRISTILKEKSYPVIKLNYYLHDEDIKQLLALQFSSNTKRKLLASEFCRQFNLLDKTQQVEYLKHYHSHFFI